MADAHGRRSWPTLRVILLAQTIRQTIPHTPDIVAPTDPWSDRSSHLAALLAKVSLGDRAAFALLYEATKSHLFAVILRINPQRAQAEDVMQEVFVNVWRAAGSFDAARSQPMTWLISLARHRAIDSLRRRKTEPQTVSASEDVDDHGLLDNTPSSDAGPLDLLQQAAQARDVVHCIDALSAEQKQSIALAYYQGLSHAEAAEQLHVPLGTVKSWVRRALIALKDCLGRPLAVGQ
jgi:RNA polymerase sigma-70 factor, ECF subfamily